MLTVLSIFGTRPEAIKMAPVIQELNAQSHRVCSITCSLGQHRQMLDQVLSLFQIKPDYELHLMQPNQTLSRLTAELFTALDPVISEVKPDWILSQGDTTSVFVAAMSAFYHKIPFGHVEAGLRTGDKEKPFPEEINRRVADIVADLYFAPTESARGALIGEGCRPENIFVTGNTVIDALHNVARRQFDWGSGPLAALPVDKRLVLVTAHRRESFGGPFRELCLAIRELALTLSSDLHFVYPVHLNPNVRQPVSDILSGLPNVSLIEPLDYLCMVHLMKRSTLILTDSGGIQEEAPGLRVPVLVMRDTTERPEGVETGVVRLVGTQKQRIVKEAKTLLSDPIAHAAMSAGANPYGDGKAAHRIVSILLERHDKKGSGRSQSGRFCDRSTAIEAATRSASIT
jgi:UDP-N-acetylglucosamine 2-epimerase (non-hydrolysing)